MGLLKPPATQDELHSYQRESEAPAEAGRGMIAGLRDDSNRLAAARGIMIGTVLGIIICGVIFWVLL